MFTSEFGLKCDFLQISYSSVKLIVKIFNMQSIFVPSNLRRWVKRYGQKCAAVNQGEDTCTSCVFF